MATSDLPQTYRCMYQSCRKPSQSVFFSVSYLSLCLSPHFSVCLSLSLPLPSTPPTPPPTHTKYYFLLNWIFFPYGQCRLTDIQISSSQSTPETQDSSGSQVKKEDRNQASRRAWLTPASLTSWLLSFYPTWAWKVTVNCSCLIATPHLGRCVCAAP